jgi:hypothetical protein
MRQTPLHHGEERWSKNMGPTSTFLPLMEGRSTARHCCRCNPLDEPLLQSDFEPDGTSGGSEIAANKGK